MSGESETPKITLHWLEKSRSQRIVWLLEELNIPYEIEIYKRDPKTHLATAELKEAHHLGKSPVLTVGDHALAESGLIVEYLSDHFGPTLIPTKWKAGCEGRVGGETEAYLRHRFFMHYCEDSLMAVLLVSLVSHSSVLLAPIMSFISMKINHSYIDPELITHFEFVERQLASAPDGGPYLCGAKLTGADIMMSFPVMLVTSEMLDRGPVSLNKTSFPRLFAYSEALKKGEGYKRAVEKIVALEGEYSLV
ncbi:glutathione S-transferase-like protein [Mycena polygramma]|nr:glutathione S-transferase-like protein [Mycena polygramma]